MKWIHALSILLTWVTLSATACQASQKSSAPQEKTWQEFTLTQLKSLDAKVNAKAEEADLGVFIKNLSSGKEVSYRGDEYWYLASGVKIPVATAVLKEIDSGELSLESKMEVLDSDYIDGAGELNYIKPGSKVSLRMLIDQSLTFSDNTATDMLIRQIGLEKVNALVQGLAPQCFKPITTLSEVRRQIFSEIHPAARTLSGMDFIKIWTTKDEQEKLARLAKLLKVKRADFKVDNLNSAYSAYYATQINSATLRGYATMLEKIDRGQVLKENSRKFLLDVLERIETGKDRVKAGLPKSFEFAHKTGTQYKRFCDMGIMTNGTANSDHVIVVACVRGLAPEESAAYLRKVGQVIAESGVLTKVSK